MKTKLNSLKAYFRKHIWVHFIFNFVFFGVGKYLLSLAFRENPHTLTMIVREAFFFSLFMTPILGIWAKLRMDMILMQW